jgi:hypothetical protein
MKGPEDFGTSEQSSRQQLLTWPLMHQRMAFYAGVYVPKVGFTLSPGEVSEYKALIQKGIDYEQKRIEKGGLPKALTLEYLREIESISN